MAEAEIKPELLPRNLSVPILPVIPFQVWRAEGGEAWEVGRESHVNPPMF